MKKLLYISLMTLLMGACARNPVTGKRQLNFMSEKQEIAMGAESDPSIVASFGLYDSPKIQEFITERGKKMVEISHRPSLDFKFKVLNSSVVNAFAVPGGYVYFTRGIMAHFNNEAEFAGVLGHEIGHVTARHSAQQYTKQILAQVGMIATIIAKPELVQFAEQAQQGLGLMFLKFGRDDESQSDKLGVSYSTKIGYDSHLMGDFFKTLGRISAAAGARIPAFLSTHPDPDDRFNMVHKLSDEAQKTLDKSTLQVNRDQYLRMIDGLVYGEDPREGYVENSVFYHPELKFQFPVPSNWKTQNSPEQFVMADPNQKAIIILTVGQGKSFEEVAANQAKMHNLDVKRADFSTVNQLPAYVMYSEVKTQQDANQQGVQRGNNAQNQATAPEKTLVQTYIIQYNNLFYVLNGVATLADFETFKSTFSSTMQGFNVLTDLSKINVQADHIRLKTCPRNSTLGECLTAWNVPQKRQEETAVLNGIYLNSPVTNGMLIKTIGK